MARDKLTDLSATASENTDLQSVNIAEGMSPGGVNNALRAMAAMLGDAFALTTPGTKLQTVQANKFHVAADTDRLQLGTTKPTEVTHDNSTYKTTIDATRSLTVKVGEPSDSGTSAFELIETDATLGELSVLKQSNAGGLQVGNADLNAQRTANGDTTAAMTVTGTLNATKFVGGRIWPDRRFNRGVHASGRHYRHVVRHNRQHPQWLGALRRPVWSARSAGPFYPGRTGVRQPCDQHDRR